MSSADFSTSIDADPTNRGCGDCSACCVALPIAAGIVAVESKPAGTACRHLCGGMCGIYAERPKTCRDFQCGWLKIEDWPRAWRPEQSHLLCLFELLDGEVPAGLIYELQPGALEDPVGAEIIRALRQRTNFVVVVDFVKNRHKLPGDVARESALV